MGVLVVLIGCHSCSECLERCRKPEARRKSSTCVSISRIHCTGKGNGGHFCQVKRVDADNAIDQDWAPEADRRTMKDTSQTDSQISDTSKDCTMVNDAFAGQLLVKIGFSTLTDQAQIRTRDFSHCGSAGTAVARLLG